MIGVNDFNFLQSNSSQDMKLGVKLIANGHFYLIKFSLGYFRCLTIEGPTGLYLLSVPS